MTKKKSVIPIFSGPTGVGKSDLAHRYSELTGAELVNADSINVYRGFDIGSAKPTKEEQEKYHYHLIDVRNPNEDFTVGDFVRQSESIILESIRKSNSVCIVGGTGFYLKALVRGLWQVPASEPELRNQLENEERTIGIQKLFERLSQLDPVAAKRISVHDRYRVIRALEIVTASGKTISEIETEHKKTADSRPYEFRMFVLDRNAEDLEKRIRLRTELMFKASWLNEVRYLSSKWKNGDQVIRPLLSVGYREIVNALNEWGSNDPNHEQIQKLKEDIFTATRQLLKRQRTWFRGQSESIPILLKDDVDPLANIMNEIKGSVLTTKTPNFESY